MKTVVRMRTNAENMKMRSRNPCRKIKEFEFFVAGFFEGQLYRLNKICYVWREKDTKGHLSQSESKSFFGLNLNNFLNFRELPINSVGSCCFCFF